MPQKTFLFLFSPFFFVFPPKICFNFQTVCLIHSHSDPYSGPAHFSHYLSLFEIMYLDVDIVRYINVEIVADPLIFQNSWEVYN